MIPSSLVLAGSRDGTDPVAVHAGVSDKALIAFGEETMLERVIMALRAAGVGHVSVAANSPAVLAEAERHGAMPFPAAAGPSASTANACWPTCHPPASTCWATRAPCRPESGLGWACARRRRVRPFCYVKYSYPRR